MSEHGQPTTPREKRLIYNYLAAFVGVMVGALGGTIVFGQTIDNPPLTALLGAALGGGIGFGAPDLLRFFGVLKAQ